MGVESTQRKGPEMNEKNELVLFKSKDGQVSLPVTLERETVWLSQRQMADLFGKDRTVIGRHIRNAIDEGEVDERVVCAVFAHTTRHGAMKGRTQQQTLVLYSLDVVISVGYRVKSPRGVEFRRWATSVLRDYLLKGAAINEMRLRQLGQAVEVMKRVSNRLDAEQVLDVVKTYPSAQEKAANLLYLVTKNHGFSDGNKRIAAGLFLYFLQRNRLLLRKDGSKRIADSTLVALTVMIAESRPAEKEMMVNLVMTFLA